MTTRVTHETVGELTPGTDVTIRNWRGITATGRLNVTYNKLTDEFYVSVPGMGFRLCKEGTPYAGEYWLDVTPL